MESTGKFYNTATNLMEGSTTQPPEPSGNLWNPVETYGTLWNLMEPCGTLWNKAEASRTFPYID